MFDPHRALREHGLQGARALAADKLERVAIDTAASFCEHGMNAQPVLVSLLAAGLPHKAPAQANCWERRLINGDILRLSARAGQETASCVIPFGSKARMILFHLQDQFFRTGNTKVAVGRSMFEWLKRIGSPGLGGRTYRIVEEQGRRLQGCSMKYSRPGNRTAIAGHLMTLGEEAILGPALTEAIALTRVDANRYALYCIANNSAALDIYLSLAWLLPRLDHPRLLDWAEIAGVFGAGFKDPYRSRAPFLRALQMVLAVFPAAEVTETAMGLLVAPSSPPQQQSSCDASTLLG